MGKNIDHHIDEYSISYKRGKAREQNKSSQKIKFIFPENYKGSSLIIYDENEGIKPDYDENGNKVYFIPQSGILKTNSSIGSDPFKIAKDEVEFYFEEGKNNFKKLNVFNPLLKLENNKIVVKIEGYNQIARDKMYDVVNFRTDNNILFLAIDSTKNLNASKFYETFEKSFKSK